MDQGCEVEIVLRFKCRRASCLRIEGEQQPSEHSKKWKAAVREKTRRPAQQSAAHATTHLRNAGSTFEYLIGQQRAQSMPHSAAKSSAHTPFNSQLRQLTNR